MKMNKEYMAMLKFSVYENSKEYKNIRKIVFAMYMTDRKYFMRKEDMANAYADVALPIGYNQTISQPTTVARMISMLDLKKKQDVLEIGSGSGWNAALIAYMVYPGKVTSIERIKGLYEFAVSNFFKFAEERKIKKLKVDFVFADALNKKEKFWKKKYDRIITTAMVSGGLSGKIKEMGAELLKEKGLLLFPYKEGLELWEKENKKLSMIGREEGYVFVPLLKGKK